jgi:hypothetical protein
VLRVDDSGGGAHMEDKGRGADVVGGLDDEMPGAVAEVGPLGDVVLGLVGRVPRRGR